MSWEQVYAERRRTAGEALDEHLRPGQTLLIAADLAEPTALIDALLPRLERLAPLTILALFVGGRARFADDAYAPWVRLRTLLPPRRLARRLAGGGAEHVPCHLSQLPRWFEDGTLRADVALLQLSPPDARGLCSLGISRLFYGEAVRHTPLVIAEVNRQMPHVTGAPAVPVERLAALVETDRPLPEVAPAPIGPLERQLGGHVAELVPNGATVEFGLGAAPEAAIRALAGHRDLGIHSGLLCDAAVDLLQAGAVTNAGKPRDRGVSVANLLLGTRRLFDYCADNLAVQLRSSSYVHDAHVIASLDRFVAINSALEVDLLGQANAETMGAARVSGSGGLLDFVRGAQAAAHGRSILVLPSTSRDGRVSRIVPRLSAGATVSVPAADADWVVTEHGAAALRGRSTAERARALIAIAHPDFRDELQQA